MTDPLESLLICCASELSGNEKDAIPSAFSYATELLLKSDEIFDKLPIQLHISSATLAEIERKAGSSTGLMKDLVTNSGSETPRSESYYQEPAVLLYDGLHGSSFGRMSFIYRAKGTRIYLTKGKKLLTISPYSTIDHRGFYLTNEIQDEISTDPLDVDSLTNTLSLVHPKAKKPNGTGFVCAELLSIICKIRKPFKKDYFLEYLLLPPDVDEISIFSQRIKRRLWDICLAKTFALNWGADTQDLCMNSLAMAQVAPSTNQLVAFIREASNIQDMIKRLDKLESNINSTIEKSTKSDILEVKPNFAGLGINFNAVVQRWRNR